MAKEKDLLMEFLEEYSVEAVDKALAIYKKIQGGIRVVDIKGSKYFLKVRSESSVSIFYDVTVTVLKGEVDVDCDCAAVKRFGSCKHGAAAAMYLLIRTHGMTFDMIHDIFDDEESDFDDYDEEDYDEEEDGNDDFIFSNKNDKSGNSNKPVMISSKTPIIAAIVPAKNNTELFAKNTVWKAFESMPSNAFYTARALLHHNNSSWQLLKNLSLVEFNEKDVTAEFIYKQNKTVSFHPNIKYNGVTTFSYSCDCNENATMCSHVGAAFELLSQKDNRHFFLKYKDWTKEKNDFLRPYGITVADPEAANFEFKIDLWGSLTMKQPSWLWKEDITEQAKGLKQLFSFQNNNKNSRPLLAENKIIDFETGFLLNLVSQHFKIGFELEPIKVYQKKDKATFKKLIIHQNDNLSLLKGMPDDLFDLIRHISDDGIKQHLTQVGHGSMFNYSSSPWQQINDSALRDLKRYYIAELQKLWPYLCGWEYVYVLKEGTFSNGNIFPAKLSPTPVRFSFEITEDERHITVRLLVNLDGATIEAAEIKDYCGFLFEIKGLLHLLADAGDTDMLKQFEYGYIKIPVAGKEQVIRSIIPLLRQKYEVVIPDSLTASVIQPEPLPQVLLKELEGKFLVLQPQYQYEGITVDYQPAPDNIFRSMPDGSFLVMERNAVKENSFFDELRGLHPKFGKPTQNDFFFLPFEETMKQNWFIETVNRLVESKIPVLGMQELTKHRYNTNKPKWEMKTGSGIDWFDLQIEISFGEQFVALRDVRKALLNKQNIVVLGDGTFGVLPEDWLKQYGLLLKMGDEQSDGTLRVSKLHYTLIDELHGQIDDEEILNELNEKKQRLQNIGSIKSVKPGKEIKATLRPYQLSGFQWFHTLDEMGWGGCLADDMGLGKTLQAITFLQYLKGKYKGSTHLVVCPTSLIYNWENELKKFGPALKYHIYYGVEREFNEEHFNDYDIIITSYGILRNDLENLMKFEWHYIILDESQAIKNPDAQTNKALQLLKSKNRMILSGTPIQNNTYDLYAQFHFINPGMLGNREFFKTEFANPIDKNNDTEKSAQLRKLIYPFMLRRTKEQVAPDLPDKTETVMWCDMGKEQRAVYNDYRNYYRSTLMDKIAEVGMAKAGMYVLEGLLRLRQICDSPQLVKDSEVTTKQSVKIDELLREIQENSGGHKLLVFSQFTEMLHLIEESMKKQKVNYVYLDGSTPAVKRKEAVQIFQDDVKIRVFLISLKAGGVGLNLTAADYVYIVDPWWNPAVEQQAIDRTHRIGQVNKIFAYKMICKDTVEEKIIQLQQTQKTTR